MNLLKKAPNFIQRFLKLKVDVRNREVQPFITKIHVATLRIWARSRYLENVQKFIFLSKLVILTQPQSPIPNPTLLAALPRPEPAAAISARRLSKEQQQWLLTIFLFLLRKVVPPVPNQLESSDPAIDPCNSPFRKLPCATHRAPRKRPRSATEKNSRGTSVPVSRCGRFVRTWPLHYVPAQPSPASENSRQGVVLFLLRVSFCRTKDKDFSLHFFLRLPLDDLDLELCKWTDSDCFGPTLRTH